MKNADYIFITLWCITLWLTIVVAERNIVAEIRKPRTVYISVDDPNLAVILAEKDASIKHWREMCETVEARERKLAENCGEK